MTPTTNQQAEREAFEAWYETAACLGVEPTWAAWQARAALSQAPVANDLDVRQIMLDVVPGDDGMGLEVYAKSVKDVESKLTEMGQRIEELEAAAKPAPVAVPDEMPLPVQSEFEADYCCGMEMGHAMGWNECRAAMLSAAPTPQPAAEPASEVLDALRAECERLRLHAVTLANFEYLAAIERCAQICDAHYNHEAKDCAEEIRALAASATPPAKPQPSEVFLTDTDNLATQLRGYAASIADEQPYWSDKIKEASEALAAQPQPSDAELDALLPFQATLLDNDKYRVRGYTPEQMLQAMRAALAKFGGAA